MFSLSLSLSLSFSLCALFVKYPSHLGFCAFVYIPVLQGQSTTIIFKFLVQSIAVWIMSVPSKLPYYMICLIVDGMVNAAVTE